MIPPRNHQLPPDPEAYRKAFHPRGRVIVIAPTRAACETIEIALGLHVETLLERQHGDELRAWAGAGKPFGIVAGTGTGKTLGIRTIAEAILEEPLRYGVVNREREATPETPAWNVVIVTTGIARRWFQDDLITGHDTVVVDEIHQTSAELELCLALGKRARCRFIWLSATVDPAFYARYLESREVLETSAFDPALRARVKVVAQKAAEFLDERFMRRIIQDRRGVAVFVPTRAEVEQLAESLGHRWNRLNAAFYHGGEPIRVIRPYLDGEVEHPFLLAMTAAGQSALNVRGLDTVVIYDARYGSVVERGRNVLHRLHLGANEILQMAGRVHGRVAGGEVYILSDRDLHFDKLRPTPPEFQLAGDAERVAITCAAIGVDAGNLDLPVALDHTAYRRSVQLLTERGLIDGGKLTTYGREVEAMPVERPWGELLVQGGPELLPVLAVCSSVDSLHRMTREERDLRGVIVPGSDHLTAYALYAEAVNRHGFLGEVHGLPRHLFEDGLDDWAERRGVLIRSIEDMALGMASVYRATEQPLPRQLPTVSPELHEAFADLVAKVGPFDLVIDERTADGQEARVSRTSVAGSWGAVAGTLRYFADRFGVARAGIEGTTLSYDQIRRHARRGRPVIELRGGKKHQRPVLVRGLNYFGFDLDVIQEDLEGGIPEDLRPAFREALVDALMAGSSHHPHQARIRRALEEAGELWRRSGGSLAAVSTEAARRALADQVRPLSTWEEFLAAPLSLRLVESVPEETRRQLDQLPSSVRILGDVVPLDYEVEAGVGVVRIRMREGQVRRVRSEMLPEFDRPVRFAAVRGQESAVQADTLDELRTLLQRRPEPKRGRSHYRQPHQRRRR
ncbi:MAG TPA: DEAD/DEAH box helicase [Gemmatimonadales bacterium]|nr:DEAD/DEAH box helicase [Gemmatimonadales bacterium]